jgi:hypothetical protein
MGVYSGFSYCVVYSVSSRVGKSTSATIQTPRQVTHRPSRTGSETPTALLVGGRVEDGAGAVALVVGLDADCIVEIAAIPQDDDDDSDDLPASGGISRARRSLRRAMRNALGCVSQVEHTG